MRPCPKRLLLPLVLLALCAPATWADNPAPQPAPAPDATVDPAWSGPPVAPEPQPVPAPAPMATPVAVPQPAAPSGRMNPSNLPPPVIRRAGQARTAVPAQAPMAAPYVPPTPIPGTSVPAPSAADASGTFPAPTSLPPPQPSAPLAAATILGVDKNHNIQLSDGSLALRLDTRFRVDDSVTHAYRVWITFFDHVTGAPIQSTKPTFADAQGGLHVMTKPVTSTAYGQEFLAPLTVPYLVFPDPGAGHSTEVEARVELTRVEGGSQETPVATSSTTFRVHGAPLETEPAPSAPTETPVSEFPAPR